MGAKLQALFALQNLELQIVDIRRQLDRKRRRVAAQTRKLEAARTAIDLERTTVKRTQAEFDQLDLDIKGRSANISRLREHLNTVRTNKDYAAVLAKLNNEKADVSRLENRALGMMQTIDARKRELTEHEQTETTEAERLEDLKAQFEQTRRSLSRRLEELQKQRQAAAEKIDHKTRAIFERLSEHYDGEALAEVERIDPRRDEFICSGCHMSLRIEVANTLKSRDEIVNCKNCGRILSMSEDT